LISGQRTVPYKYIGEKLEGHTETAVISFIDLYPKVRRNFPEAKRRAGSLRLLSCL